MTKEKILSVKDLKIDILKKKGSVPVVRGLSFSMIKGESLCIVGESGCGKSVTALSILGLLPTPPFRLRAGSIIFRDKELTKLTSQDYQTIRGRMISLVFQEPMTALNPVFTIGEQIDEAISTHMDINRAERKQRIINLLSQVGVPEPEKRMNSYPHQLSGGLRQRAMIAMALSCDPELLIADEPTTALDVTIQAQILNLLKKLQKKYGLSLLLITHNLGVVAQVAKKVLIMYAGKIVEKANVRELFADPLHPYTRGLMASIPYSTSVDLKRLPSIKGNVPSLDSIPPGCAFHDRCPMVMEICRHEIPRERAVGENRFVACHLY